MIGLPPSDGAVQLTIADPSPAVAVTEVGAEGAEGCEPVRATSSRYMEVSSAGTPASSCTLNQSTIVCPAYALVSTLTWVQVWALEFSLKTDVRVPPAVLVDDWALATPALLEFYTDL